MIKENKHGTSSGFNGKNTADNNQKNSDKKPSRSEWAIAAVGLALVSVSLSVILYQALWHKETPPEVQVALEAPQPVTGGYIVPFKAINMGSTTAAGLIIKATLKNGSSEIETSETTLDYLPANSSRKGGFFFRQNPAAYQLEAFATAFQEP